MTNRGMVVNLYMINKMFGGDCGIDGVKDMLEKAYPVDLRYNRDVKGMTFSEYVNYKRNFVASVMGLREYL